jgi:hypothetical protein
MLLAIEGVALTVVFAEDRVDVVVVLCLGRDKPNPWQWDLAAEKLLTQMWMLGLVWQHLHSCCCGSRNAVVLRLIAD